MNQSDLANKIGLSRSSVTNIEHGSHQLSVHMLYSIADALKLNPKDLLPHKKYLRPTKTLRLRSYLTPNVAADVVGLYQRMTDNIIEESKRRSRAANEKS